ncbi:MAG: homoserine O-acetyltransferase [Cyclobacteriaceae bacterium]
MSIAVEEKIFHYKQPFDLESGEYLPSVKVKYTTYGTLSPQKDNVIWICHALTADANPADWWEGLVGEGKLYDPNKYFIICANMIGSCYGSSGPLDINPTTMRLYQHDFPQVTVRDMVKGLDLLREELKIDSIHTLIGGSMGGMQALEWSCEKPDLFQNMIVLATNASHSAWGIAFNETQRMTIKADPTWKRSDENAGRNGLKAARALALISYRNYDAYCNTQSETDIEKLDRYKASSYQEYQGDKLVSRFNVVSYMLLSKAMDSHQVGRGRGSVEEALAKVTANTLSIGVSSDILFPPVEQKRIADLISDAEYQEIDSFYGHDGFLVESKAITEIILAFYKSKNVNFMSHAENY